MFIICVYLYKMMYHPQIVGGFVDFIVPPRSSYAPPTVVLPSGLRNGVDAEFEGCELIQSAIVALKVSQETLRAVGR